MRDDLLLYCFSHVRCRPHFQQPKGSLVRHATIFRVFIEVNDTNYFERCLTAHLKTFTKRSPSSTAYIYVSWKQFNIIRDTRLQKPTARFFEAHAQPGHSIPKWPNDQTRKLIVTVAFMNTIWSISWIISRVRMSMLCCCHWSCCACVAHRYGLVSLYQMFDKNHRAMSNSQSWNFQLTSTGAK